MNLKKIALVVCAGALVVAAGACSSSSDSGSSTGSTTTTAAAGGSTTTTAQTTTTAAADVSAPAPSGATQESQNSIADGGQHTYYVTSEGYQQVVSSYEATLQSAGWAVQGSGGGGGDNRYGGGGLTATHGSNYLVMNAGTGSTQTYIDICVWPSQPSDTNCGNQDDNDDNNQNDD